MADSKGTKLTVDEIETLKCSKCNFSSTTLVRLKRHVKIHSDNKRFKCRECDFQTSESGNLKRHLKRHLGIKPVKKEIDITKLKHCFKCDFSSLTPSDLKRHEMTHTGEVPHKCNKCDYAASQASNLKRHIYDMHTENKLPKPPRVYKNRVQCSQCEFTTTHNSKLRRHEMTHTGETPFSCNHCDFATAQEGSLKRHMETHKENRERKVIQKPLRCLQCNKYSFSSVSKLAKHLMTHTGDKPHLCEQCDYASSHPGNLKRHIRTHHSGIKPEPRKNPNRCSFPLCTFSGWKLKRHLKTHENNNVSNTPAEVKIEIKNEDSYPENSKEKHR